MIVRLNQIPRMFIQISELISCITLDTNESYGVNYNHGNGFTIFGLNGTILNIFNPDSMVYFILETIYKELGPYIVLNTALNKEHYDLVFVNEYPTFYTLESLTRHAQTDADAPAFLDEIVLIHENNCKGNSGDCTNFVSI